MSLCLIGVCGIDRADGRGLLSAGVCSKPPFAEDCFHHLSVPGTHAVVDEDVEGGVDVGVDLQEPEGREERVLVAASRVQLRHEGQHQPA